MDRPDGQPVKRQDLVQALRDSYETCSRPRSPSASSPPRSSSSCRSCSTTSPNSRAGAVAPNRETRRSPAPSAAASGIFGADAS